MKYRIALPWLIALGAALSSAATVQAQAGAETSDLAKRYKVDFAIPDGPAFKLLDPGSKTILRPQTVRELGVALGNFGSVGSGFALPKKFGIEISPAMLISDARLSRASYTAQKFLYATRLSGAVNRDSMNRSEMAIGLRFSIKDEQDMRRLGAGGTDTALTRVTQEVLDVYVKARERVGPRAPLALNAVEEKKVQAIVDSIKGYWANKYWNATALELAFATRARGTDSTGKDPKIQELSAWLTYSHSVGGWGQLLFGGRLASVRDDAGAFQSTESVAARFYFGSNQLKGFAEGEGKFASSATTQWFFNGGIEARLPVVGWVEASAGYESSPAGGAARLRTALKLKTSFPGTN